MKGSRFPISRALSAKEWAIPTETNCRGEQQTHPLDFPQ